MADPAEQQPAGVPGPDLPPVTAPWIDKKSAAAAEEKEWSELEDAKFQNDLAMVKAYGIIVLIFAGTFSLIFLISLLAWVAHYLIPPSCAWLSADQLGKIQSVLFSGGMGAVISSIAKSQLDRISAKKSR